MRADARRNKARLLEVARDVFVEAGPEASLEEMARRARVGIATLYRHFPDRNTLMREVVLTALIATADAAEGAPADSADPFEALAGYMHAVLDLRTSAVISTLLDALDLEEPQLKAARERSARAAERLVEAAHRSGALHPDATFGDIGVMLVRLSRPLPGSLPEGTQAGLAHRHADVFLAGLRRESAPATLHGPALERADLHRLQQPDATSEASA